MRELREKYIHGKEPLMLAKVDEIHVVCGLLKDFLRKLKEPLITFRLHKSFMDAAGMLSHSNGHHVHCKCQEKQGAYIYYS